MTVSFPLGRAAGIKLSFRTRPYRVRNLLYCNVGEQQIYCPNCTRIASTRARFTPKSRMPKRDAERT